MEFDRYLDTESVEVYGVPNDAVLGIMKQIGDQFGGSGISCESGPTPWAGSPAPDDLALVLDPYYRRSSGETSPSLSFARVLKIGVESGPKWMLFKPLRGPATSHQDRRGLIQRAN
jgi:hypothetical protein